MSNAFNKAYSIIKNYNARGDPTMKPVCKECGFPIDPTHEFYPPGSECICDLKSANNS